MTPVDNIELKKKWPEVYKRWDCNQGLCDVQTFLSPLYHACSQERGADPAPLAGQGEATGSLATEMTGKSRRELLVNCLLKICSSPTEQP